MNLTCSILSDEDLVAACRQGNYDSFALLYQRYFDKVYHSCLTMLKDADEARDVAQDSLLKAYEKLDSFRGTASYSTWLFSITRNECLQYLRKTRRRSMVPLSDTYDVAEEENSEMQAKQQLQEEAVFTASLQQLSQEEQQLLLMKYWHHASTKDLQQSLGLATASAVKMRLQRARNHMLHLYQQIAL